jgi:hypothetical protein
MDLMNRSWQDASNLQGGRVDLIQQIAVLTQLPPEMVTKELYRIAKTKGYDVENLDMDHLRSILSAYVEEVLSNINEDMTAKASQ